MLLKKITLNNFKQFYGEQEIDFSVDPEKPEKNVTLIHAENGVGKTQLLNALRWCFYGTDTDNILSHQAKKEGNTEVKVKILFEHQNKIYEVSRNKGDIKKNDTFEAFNIEKGSFKELPAAPEIFVRSVVPEEMSGYFFFNGEDATTLFDQNNKDDVKKAIEAMLGCNIANKAENDLKTVKKRIENDLGELAEKHKEANEYEGERVILEKKIKEKKEKMDKNDEDIKTIEGQIKDISNELKGLKDTAEIEAKREKLKADKEKAEKETRQSLKKKQVEWIRKSSISLLSQKAISFCSKAIKNADAEGRLPSKIAEIFVKSILEKKTCICERSFKDGSSEQAAIKSLLAEAGNKVMYNRCVRIGVYKGSLSKISPKDIIVEIKNINTDIYDNDNNIKRRGDDIKKLDKELGNSNKSNVAEKQKSRQEKELSLIEFKSNKLIFEHKHKEMEKEKNNIIDIIGNLLKNDCRTIPLKRKSKILDATINRLTKELDKYKEKARKNIEEKLNEILTTTYRKDFYVKIDEAFKLKMYSEQANKEGDGREVVGMSEGEKQLLSLAFTASLVRFAADRREDKKELLKPGTMAPLMLDSPFGQLDKEYKKSTVEFLPKLADQVVLLVSQTQGGEDVMKALGERVGHEYILISEITGQQGDKPLDEIQLHGKTIACASYGCKKDKTRIQKVGRNGK